MSHPSHTLHPAAPLAVFCCFISIFLSLLYFLFRLGFNDMHGTSVIVACGTSCFLVSASILGRGATSGEAIWYRCDAFSTLVLLSGLVALGMLAGRFEALHVVKWLPVCAGFFGFFLLCARTAGKWGALRLLTYLVLGLVISLWIGAVFWGYGVYSPLFFESFAVGLPHVDALFHISTAQMLKTYGIAASGVNGLTYYPYHAGSHYVFSQMSNLLRIDLLRFYPLAFPVIFLPLFLKALLGFVRTIRARVLGEELFQPHRDPFFWLVLFAAIIGYLDFDYLNEAGAASYVFMLSESYSLSMSVLFLLLTLLVKFWIGYRARTQVMADKLFLFVVLPVLVLALGLFKMSTQFITQVMMAYCFLRFGLYKSWEAWVSMMLGGSMSLLTMWLVLDMSHTNTSLHFFHYLNAYVHVPIPFFFLIFYCWIIVLATLIWSRRRIREEQSTGFPGDSLAIEVVVVIAVVGLIPGSLLEIAGGSAAYFMDPQYWISLALVLAFLPAAGTWFPPLPVVRKWVVVACGILVAYSMALNFRHHFWELQHKYMSLRKHMWDGTDGAFKSRRELSAEIFVPENSFVTNWTNLLRKPQEAILHDREFVFFSGLRDLREIDRKSKAVVFIENKHGLHSDFPCNAVPFVIPALSGISTYNGVPYDYCPEQYGFEQMPLESRTEIGRLNKPSDLCAEVAESGIEKVVILYYSPFKSDSIRTFTCKSGASAADTVLSR